MWDKPFSTEMLTGGGCVVVNCPDEDLEREFAAILTAFGINYPDGRSPISTKNVWSQYEEKFCYFIRGGAVRRGRKSDAKNHSWADSEKCTFYGEQTEDISDESFAAIIGR